MPPANPIATPAGTLNLPDALPAAPEQERAALIAAAHRDLERCQELRAQALETPIGAEWTTRDRWDYMRHLDETEAALKGGKP